MTPVTLVANGDASARETVIAARLAALPQFGAHCAAILEGVPENAVLFDPLVRVSRIAPGCPCCTGNLTMRVTLNRLLRPPPAHLFISIADATHLDAIRHFLTQPPYDRLLKLNDTISK
jgi:hypothetical protein